MAGFTIIHEKGRPYFSTDEDRSEDLRIIRSHAMRSLWSQKRGPKRNHNADHKLHKAERKSKQRLTQGLPMHDEKKPMSFDSRFAAPWHGAGIDLQMLPGKFDSNIHYFASVFMATILPSLKTVCISGTVRAALVEGDIALMRAICVLSSTHQELMRATDPKTDGQGKDAIQGLLHKALALSTLNRKLNEYHGPCSRLSLSTVALLLTTESLAGNQGAANAHKRGLCQMIDLQSGLQRLERGLCIDLLFADIKSASSNLSRPLIGMPIERKVEYETYEKTPFHPFRPGMARLGLGFFTNRYGLGLDARALSALRVIRLVVNSIESDASNSYAASINSLQAEYHLLHRRHNEESSMADCIRIAALLYCNLGIWNWPPNSRLITNLIESLYHALAKTDRFALALEPMETVVWLLFMGCAGSSQTSSSSWFLKEFFATLQMLDAKDMAHIEWILSAFLYSDRVFRAILEKICEDMDFT